jgi:uncharacterized protein YrrD
VADPVSWKVAEKGWKVLSESGEELGRVADVRGDREADIFDGIDVRRGLLKGKDYIPSERVAEIREGVFVVR